MSVVTKLVIATAAAGVLVVGFVLPAEYGVDPTGIGKLTGLTTLAAPQPPGATQDFGQTMSFNVEEYDVAAEVIDRSIQGLIYLEDAPFRTETIVIDIEDFGEVEYKFKMQEETAIVYSWEVANTRGEGVYYDFHGHPATADAANFPEGFEMAYSRSEGTGQSGAFTAPFTGLHGFYFMNLEEGPIQINLTVSGYYETHQEYYRAVEGEVVNLVDF